MKYLNGQACKKPVRKITLIFGIVLLSVSLLILLITLPVTMNAKDLTDRIMPFVFFAFCFVPGLILLIVGITKLASNSKEYKKSLSTDYEAWKAEHIDDQASPLFSARCGHCGGLIEYDLQGIDGTRPWFPDGYLICPACHANIRHDAKSAITTQQQTSGTAQL